MRLPSRHTEQVHLDDAALTAEAVGLPGGEPPDGLDRAAAGRPRARARPDVAGADLRFGNASARSRMIVIFDVAQAVHGLVIGTENRTENLLGYFTRFGDAASDVEPISRSVQDRGAAGGATARPARGGALPSTRRPGLWGGQTDEDELGIHLSRRRPERWRRSSTAGSDDAAAAELTGVDLEVVRRVRARAESVAWKLIVPHTLSV